MGTKLTQREIDFCDVCKREGSTYNVCLVCKAEFCFMCDALIPGCIIKPEVCKPCAKREDVLAIVAEWASKIDAPRKKRDAKLAELYK